MSVWHRLLRALGFIRPPRISLNMEQGAFQSLRYLAEQEQRPPEAVAADLLSFALAQRQAADENLSRWDLLSPREQQVAALVCLGYTNRQIAARLLLSPETVKTHVRNMLRKFDLHRKTDLRRVLKEWDFSAWYEAGL